MPFGQPLLVVHWHLISNCEVVLSLRSVNMRKAGLLRAQLGAILAQRRDVEVRRVRLASLTKLRILNTPLRVVCLQGQHRWVVDEASSA